MCGVIFGVKNVPYGNELTRLYSCIYIVYKIRILMMKSKITLLTLTFSILVVFLAKAQMEIGGETFYGNEWIDYNQDHYKITVAQDGIYRLTYQALNSAGVFSGPTTPTGAELKLYHMGQLVPIYVSNTGTLGNSDYVEFYGLKNRGDLDVHLYLDANDQLNPEYSMFTDVSSYFLTWNTEPGLFFDAATNDLSNLPAPEAYCIDKEEMIFSDHLEKGRNYGSGSWKCRYDLGEGFARLSFNNSQLLTFDLSDRSAAGPNATISTRIFSETGNHAINVELNDNLVVADNYSSWAVRQINGSVPANSLLAGNNQIRVTGNASSGDDKFRMATASVEYPRTFNFGGAELVEFFIPSGTGKRYLEINNFNIGGQNPVLYDITNRLRLETQLNGNTIRAVLPPATGEREIVLVSSSATPLSLNKRTFTNYDFANTAYDYIMLTHADLLDDGNGNNYIQDYADYRATSQGGEYTPVIIDITQVYDQFGYGVDRHEMAVKNCMKLAANHWQPKLLFIIGKGVTYQLMRQNAAEWQQYSFVPSFGFPSSDHLLVAPIGGSVPDMGVGRLAAKNTDDIRLYLNKVIEYEAVPNTVAQTIEDKSWMKKVLHFGGGDAAIQNTIRNELNALKDTIDQSTLGGDVTSFFKDCADVVCPVDPDQAVPMINDGALMLTFFGHSAPSTLDFDLGDPNEYDNAGRYPFFYAIGCNTNRIFETESTLSEDFVLIENKGCIGFFGATWITSLGNLSQYGKYFYNNLGTNHYGETLGEIIKETIEDYNFSGSYTAELLRNALILHGDPAIKLYPFETPDYLVKKTDSKISPSVINALDNDFDLDLVITNIGKGQEDSINIKLEHELPNGDIVDMGTHRINAPKLNEYLSYNLPLIDNGGTIGLNYINITVDVDDEISEMPAGAESNNFERIPFFVVANDIFPVYPYEFSIVSEATPTLKASTANVFSEELNYYFEIDTTELFNSSMKVSDVQSAVGGVLDWTPNIQMLDNTVYYWRVSIDSTIIDGDFNWHNSSFIYIPNSSEGWNQSHFWQYTKDKFDGISQDSSSYGIAYDKRNYTFNHVNAAIGTIPFADMHLFREDFRISSYFPCSPNNSHRTVWILGFDPVTLLRGQIPPGSPSYNCFGGQAYSMIRYPNIASEREEMMDFIENVIPDNYYVVFFTTQTLNNNYHADEWAADSITYGRNLFSVLESHGAVNVRNLENQQTPYICVFKKDDPSFFTREFHADSISQILDVEYVLEGVERESSISSTIIGPATNWETLLWNATDYDPTIEDANIDIIGINNNGVETILVDSLTQYDYPLNGIDANQYPFIKLVYNTVDSADHTMPQLDYWRVLYDPVPEAALVPNKQFSFQSDTLQQGEPLLVEIGIENISNEDMDSLLMNYTVIDAENNQIVKTERLQPLSAGGLILGKLNLDTRDLLGDNQLIIEANPNDDQPELHHYNNIGVRSFFVEGDKRNPLLDVTFDGIHIMDGDLVSSVPEISISLLDENPYLALTDTSLLRLFVTDPDGQVAEYEVDGDILTFFPASGNLADDNRARMEFRPELLIDGTYELEVRGKDASGNNSGNLNYKVNFEVINEESVSNVLNYPNPFSTSTQFVFTLTGNELPDVFRIQIMTVSGKVVKQIDMGDLGLLRIGNNISDYRWDGTDDYGDKLANGVYIYRVIVKKNGEEYESYDNGTNQYFKKGFGKLVILR